MALNRKIVELAAFKWKNSGVNSVEPENFGVDGVQLEK